MKRLTYISKFSRPLSNKDVEEIGRISQLNNQRNYITGVLLCSGGVFFQILEGDEDKIDKLYEKILRDDRHTDVLCLKREFSIQERKFPDWSMKVINLDENTDRLVETIKILLETVTNSHRILEKYTQPTIINIINSGLNPLKILPHAAEKVVLFSDIISFSTFSEKLPVEEVVLLMNQYFSICTNIISQRGGEVTKFIGDCVMAYFSSEQTDNAIQASIDILTEMANLRNLAPEVSPERMLYNGIGLSRGMVIEGNIGSSIKMDYTILGDAVNVAARLESLSRNLPRSLVLSGNVKNHTKAPWDFLKFGTCRLKGKEELIEIYSIDHKSTVKQTDGKQLAREISDYLTEINRSRLTKVEA